VPARAGQYSSQALVAQQLAAVYVAGQGSVPRWFAEGTGRVVAARLAPKDSRVVQWDESLPSALAAMTKADDFLMGKPAEEEAMIAAYSFLKYLMKDAGKYRKLLESLRGGAEFDAAFASAFGGPPAQVAQTWAAQAARRRP
jgi:hypothetical protein